jgi:hypothetical protein
MAAIASFKSTFPVYKALPTITPLTPKDSKDNKLSKSVNELIPPEAITGISVTFANSLKASKLGPIKYHHG